VNSYKRINAPVTTSGATWSPSSISWAGNNRTHMIRIPGPGRMEYRLADGAANPYLLQAGLMAAGLDGIANSIDPAPRMDNDMYTAAPGTEIRRLPLNLLDAIRAFEANSTLAHALGTPFAAAYAKLKHQEWSAYSRHLTQWERDTTLDC
jgi:glutamine synthetase